MPGHKPIRSPAWAWFRAELERRLGKEQADALWAELAEHRAMERVANEQRRAPQMIAELEKMIAYRRSQLQSTARLEKQLARWHSLLSENDPS